MFDACVDALVEVWAIATRLSPVHDAAGTGIEWITMMQAAAIIPDKNIPDLPAVVPRQPVLGCMLPERI